VLSDFNSYLKTAIKSHSLFECIASDSHSVDGCRDSVLFIGFEWYPEHLRVFFAFVAVFYVLMYIAGGREASLENQTS
jgi:hypothetical protein